MFGIFEMGVFKFMNDFGGGKGRGGGVIGCWN